MIKVSLYDACGDIYTIAAHPVFVDFAERTDARLTEEARFGIDSANAVAPIVATLNNLTASIR
jgi:hypothetical protein